MKELAELEALRILGIYYSVLREPVVYFTNVQMRYDTAMECAMIAVKNMIAVADDERTEFYKEVKNELKKM